MREGNVKQPQGMAREETGLDLLWESGGITGCVHRGSRMTRNSLMILMPRNATGLDRQDNVRLEAPDLLDQTLDDLPGGRLHKGVRMILRQCISPARITIAQHDRFLQAQYRTRASQFLVPYLS